MSLAAFTQVVLQVQALYQRLSLFGPLGESLLLLGVPTGAADTLTLVTAPYVADGDTWVTVAAVSAPPRWLGWALAAPAVTVHVRSHSGPARATLIADAAERQRVFELFQRQRARHFPHVFRVALTADPAALAQALAAHHLVRLTPLPPSS